MNGLGDLSGADVVAVREVGDGAGDLQDARVGAGAQAEATHGAIEEVGAGRVRTGVRVELARAHLCGERQ